MRTKLNTVIIIFLLLNAVSMWIFWIGYILDFKNQNVIFSQNLSSFMVTHIASELSIGIFTVIACLMYFKQSLTFSKIWFFTLGMNFYAAFQATGWAFSNAQYPVFGLLLFNMVLVLTYLVCSMVKAKTITLTNRTITADP